jgi:hypothetical protein
VQSRSTLTWNLKPASGLKTITSRRNGLQILGPIGTTLVEEVGICLGLVGVVPKFPLMETEVVSLLGACT